MATIKDVAKLAGVSIATVSNYLNNTKPVSKAVSAKIKEAVEILQYSQNLPAKNLKSNSYTDIGVILPNFNDSYYVQLFQGIENFFQNTGYYINLSFSYDIPDFEQNIVNNFLKKQICGLILVSCQPDNWKYYYEHFTSAQKPIVLIDRNIHSLDANFVSFDNYSIVQYMTRNLIAHHYKNIFLMSGPMQYTCERNCMEGFQAAFAESDLPFNPSAIIETTASKEDAFRKTINIFKTEKPETIIATSESIATGIIEGLNILGFGKQEIPVLSLGEEHWNLHTHSFASMSAARPAMKLGQTASSLLFEQLSAPLTKETEKIILKNPALENRLTFSDRKITEEKPTLDEDPQTVIRILMLDTPQIHVLEGLLKNFENLTGIHAQITILPHHNLYETILDIAKMPEDQVYDVIMYDLPWLSTLASFHILEDITEELSSFDLNIFFPDCLQYFSSFNQRYYGIPYMYAPQIFYYRKDLFENLALKSAYERKNNITLRPPLTLKEFNTIAEYFTSETNVIDYGITIPAAYDECLSPEIYMRLRAYGGGLFDSRGNVCLDSAQSLKAYINLVRAVKCAKPNYRTATDVVAVEDFLKGDTAMLITYPSFLTDVVDLRKSSMIGSIGYHHIPGRSPLLGGWGLGISSYSHKKKEAFQFLKWTCDEQVANYLTLLGGQSAITSTYTNDELIKLYPWLPLYHATYKYTKPTLPPKSKNNVILSQKEIDAIVCKWIYPLLDEKIEVQEAIFRTHSELEILASRYKY